MMAQKLMRRFLAGQSSRWMASRAILANRANAVNLGHKVSLGHKVRLGHKVNLGKMEAGIQCAVGQQTRWRMDLSTTFLIQCCWLSSWGMRTLRRQKGLQHWRWKSGSRKH